MDEFFNIVPIAFGPMRKEFFLMSSALVIMVRVFDNDPGDRDTIPDQVS